MIGIAKSQDDDRNDYGLPIVAADAQDNRGNFNQQVEINKALPWVAFSWFLSGGAIIGLFLMALLMPKLIDAGVAKAVSEARANASIELNDAKAQFGIQLAQVKSDATAIANTGREHARIALDKVEQTQVQLGAKGLIKPETH